MGALAAPPATMQALVKAAQGAEHVGLAEVSRPEPAPGQVLVAVSATGICGTDLHIVADEFPSAPPVVMGHEITGVVTAAGSAAEEGWLGRRVALETYAVTCGRCPACRDGAINLCPRRRSIGSHVDGGFAPFVAVRAENLHEVDAALPDAAGALYEPLACVAHCLCDPAVASPSDRALVMGPGTIGLLAAQVLRAQGADVTVVGAARDTARLAVAADLGLATLTADELAAALDRADPAGPVDVDVVADCSGAAPAVAAGLRAARKGGRYVQIGLAGRPIPVDLDAICLRELTVTSGFASTPRSWRRAERLVAAGAVRLAPLVSAVHPLADWAAAFDRTRRADGVKIVLDPRDAS